MSYTKLKIHIIQNQISQSQLSEDTGLHKNTVSKLLRTGEGSKSTKELVRFYLRLEKEEFYPLLED